MSYPGAERLDLIETLHGHPVADPYRWLEDPDDPRTIAWSAAQDELVRPRLDALPGRDGLAARMHELLAAGYVSVPTWRAGRQFCTRRDPGQEHAVLHVQDADGTERALLDPMALDPSGLTTLDGWAPDLEGRRLAYQLSVGGDEHSVLRVLDVTSGEQAEPPIDRCRYSSVAWLPGGEEFFVVRMVGEDEARPGEQAFHRRIWRHRVGTPTEADELVDGPGLYADHTYYAVTLSRDGRWLVVDGNVGTARRDSLWIAELHGSTTPPLTPVLTQADDVRCSAWVDRDGLLHLMTTDGAPRWRLAVTDPRTPGREHWRELVAEDPGAVLQAVRRLEPAGDGEPLLALLRSRHAVAEIALHAAADGAPRGAVALPGPGSVGGLSVADHDTPEQAGRLWVGWEDFVTPPGVHRFDLASGTTVRELAAPGAVAVPAVRSEQREFTSADGTTVRMFVLTGDGGADSASTGERMSGGADSASTGERMSGGADSASTGERMSGGADSASTGERMSGGADSASTGERMSAAGPRPTLVTGYGGFGVSREPGYSAAALTWLAAGGNYVVVSLRGGGEEGEQWHLAGNRGNKHNVFDDLHAAAESLIAAGTTTAEQLSIIGGSNGGLLVGAALTQRPELYRAVVCSAPLLDMVRYEEFSLGRTWNDEYGTADDADELGWLLSYSPYHHVRPAACYPAVLFTVYDSDSRVDPLHARKMCAALQFATVGDPAERPVLLRRETDVGHGARSVSRTVGVTVDQLAFLSAHTGLELT